MNRTAQEMCWSVTYNLPGRAVDHDVGADPDVIAG
jgi:hypothetical protein